MSVLDLLIVFFNLKGNEQIEIKCSLVPRRSPRRHCEETLGSGLKTTCVNNFSSFVCFWRALTYKYNRYRAVEDFMTWNVIGFRWIHFSFRKCLLCACYASGTVPAAGSFGSERGRRKSPWHGAVFCWEKRVKLYVGKCRREKEASWGGWSRSQAASAADGQSPGDG